jgi:hypothetical protein
VGQFPVSAFIRHLPRFAVVESRSDVSGVKMRFQLRYDAMKRNIGCLLAASAPILAIVIFIYGLNPWFRPDITTRKLVTGNPTSYIFKSSLADVRAALRKKDVQCCGKAIEFKDNAFFSGSILGLPGNEKDAYIHNFHDPIGPSVIYFSGENPLLYICEFQLHIVPISPVETRVTVIAHDPEVIAGESWWGPHGSPANIYKSVKPTSIEEYKILLELGSSLGAVNMPPLLFQTIK